MTSIDGQATILVRAKNEAWQEPQQVGYLSEADMQQMLAAQPALIPGVGPHALAAREFSTGVGPTDVVVVDEDGSVTVVECKLASNAEVRRKIVGQVLDYAARLWRMPLADFEARWKQCSAETGVLDALDEQSVIDLGAALDEGAFRLVLAVDSINEDLRRIVEFVNAHTSDQVTVLAVELRRVSHGGVDILTPRTFGGELARAKKDKADREKRDNWTVEQVQERLGELDPDLGATFTAMHDALIDLGCEAIGTSAVQPSMIFKAIAANGHVCWPYAIYTDGKPTVQINFQWLSKADAAARDAFLEALAVSPTALDGEQVRTSNFRKRPNLPLALLKDVAAREQFIEAVRRLTEPPTAPEPPL